MQKHSVVGIETPTIVTATPHYQFVEQDVTNHLWCDAIGYANYDELFFAFRAGLVFSVAFYKTKNLPFVVTMKAVSSTLMFGVLPFLPNLLCYVDCHEGAKNDQERHVDSAHRSA